MEAAVASHVKRLCARCVQKAALPMASKSSSTPIVSKKTFHSITTQLQVNCTNDLLTIATEANRHLQRIFREGYGYKKAGVLLLGLAPEGHQQLPLFADTIKQKRNGRIELKVKRQRLNEAIEDIVQRYGNHTINLGRFHRPSIRKPHRWQQNRNKLSPNYTTNWSHILTNKSALTSPWTK